MALEEATETSDVPEKKDGTLLEAWARQAGVTPKGQRDDREADVWLSRKPQHTRGPGDLPPGKWRG